MESISEILTRRGQEAVKRIQDNIPSASGKTKESVRYEVSEGSGKVTLTIIGGRPFFPALETGSKPSDKNPHPDMVTSLKEWMEIRGIQGSAYGMARGILKRGSRLWRDGGRRDIYTNVKNDILELIAQDMRTAARGKLVDILKA